MILIIHDLDIDTENKFNFPKDSVIIRDDKSINKCLGCFKCWTENNFKCIINDNYSNSAELLHQADKVIVITKNYYGMFSPFIKNVFDRSIGFISPYFQTIFGEIHHKYRYFNIIQMQYYIYGDITDNERKTFTELIDANRENLNSEYTINFLENIEEFNYE